jgi:hypothetical protein
MKERGNQQVQGRALVSDDATGPFVMRLSGALHGNTLTLALRNFRSLSAGIALPFSGEISLSTNDARNEANGTWKTIIGTNGACRLVAAEMSARKWRFAVAGAWLRFMWQLLRIAATRALPWFYTFGLFTMLILSGTHKFDLSYPEVILALAPAPFLFKDQIGALIHTWRISEIGPIKIQIPLTGSRDDAQEAAWSAYLDIHLVPNSKRLLQWLAAYQAVSQSSFETTAATTGVPPENIQATWEALIGSRCTIENGTNLVITDFGRRYVSHLVDKAGQSGYRSA